jgi:hypothetical protein
VNFDPQSHTWTVRETDYCLFHVEAAIAGAEDLDAVVEGADQRYLRIRRALGQWPRTAPTARHRERLLKLNYWLYGQSAVPDTAMPPGAAGPAGVVFAVRNFPWSECLDALFHETIHALWAADVGEAPSLLNEGVAVYFQSLLDERPETRLRLLRDAWREVVCSGAVHLRDLCRNETFWRDHRQDRGLPPGAYYRVGGALVGYLAEVHGAPLLRRIFRRTQYRDVHLAAVIERVLGTTLDDLVPTITRWWEHRLD